MSPDLTKFTCGYKYRRIIDIAGNMIHPETINVYKTNAYDCYNSVLSGFLTENPDHPIMIAVVCAPSVVPYDTTARDNPICVNMFNQVLGGMDDPAKPLGDNIPFYTSKDVTYYWTQYDPDGEMGDVGGNYHNKVPSAFDARDINAIIKDLLLNFWLDYQGKIRAITDDDQINVRSFFDAACYAPAANATQFAEHLGKILTAPQPSSKKQSMLSRLLQLPNHIAKPPMHRLRFILWLPADCFEPLCTYVDELFPFVDRIIDLTPRMTDSDRSKWMEIFKESYENDLDFARGILKYEYEYSPELYTENISSKERDSSEFANELPEQIK